LHWNYSRNNRAVARVAAEAVELELELQQRQQSWRAACWSCGRSKTLGHRHGFSFDLGLPLGSMHPAFIMRKGNEGGLLPF